MTVEMLVLILRELVAFSLDFFLGRPLDLPSGTILAIIEYQGEYSKYSYQLVRKTADSA